MGRLVSFLFLATVRHHEKIHGVLESAHPTDKRQLCQKMFSFGQLQVSWNSRPI
jgi:hypothetical protein